ncbi:unnamed protein product [Calypogeia fissa]
MTVTNALWCSGFPAQIVIPGRKECSAQEHSSGGPGSRQQRPSGDGAEDQTAPTERPSDLPSPWKRWERGHHQAEEPVLLTVREPEVGLGLQTANPGVPSFVRGTVQSSRGWVERANNHRVTSGIRLAAQKMPRHGHQKAFQFVQV